MATTETLTGLADVFPVGTSVSAYLAAAHRPGGTPTGPSVESQNVTSSGTLTYTTLASYTSYTAYAQVSGQHRYVDFMTGASTGTVPTGDPGTYWATDQEVKDAITAAFSDVEINLGRFAPGDGSDQSAAIADAFSRVPDGGTLFIPDGHFVSSSQVLVSTRINLRGEGIGSVLDFNVGTSTDGLVIDGPGLLYGLMWKNFAIAGGANATRNAFVIREVADSSFDEIYVRCGTKTTGDAVSAATPATTGYGVSIEGSLINRFRLVLSSNMTLPVADAMSRNGIRVVSTASYPAGDNKLDCIVEGASGDGLVVDSAQTNNSIKGTYEGNVGKSIWVRNANVWEASQLHIEASSGHMADRNPFVVENSVYGMIGPDVLCDAVLSIVNSSDLTIDGVRANTVSADAACKRLKWGLLVYDVNFGTFTDLSQNPTSDGRLIDAGSQDLNLASATASVTGLGPQESLDYLTNGRCEFWTPSGLLDATTDQGAVVQETTIKRSGSSSAKLTAANHEAIHFKVPTLEVPRLVGSYVTFTVWVYIPSGQANQPSLSPSVWFNSGATTVSAPGVTATDSWTQVRLTAYVPAGTTDVWGTIRNGTTGAGNWYVDDASVVIGRVAPRDRSTRVPRRASAQVTWDPANIADGAMTSVSTTVPGAALGDLAVAAFSNAVPVGALLSAHVTATDTVAVTLFNKTGGALDLASGTLRVDAVRY